MPIILNQAIISTTTTTTTTTTTVCDEQRETLKLQIEPGEYNETNFKRTVLNASGTPINGAFTFWSAPSIAAPITSLSNLSATTTVISSEQDLTPLTPSTSDLAINGNNNINNSSNVKVLKPVPLVIRTQSADEIAGAVAHPTKPSEIRKLIRSKMVRCRICRNRFLDKHIYERHLRDRHPNEHAVYLSQQEEEVRQQRKEEFEANRLDEIVSGGFIPPQEDLDASKYEVDVKEIPLPGELTGGVPARFDRFGVLYQPKRVYKKKVSPQCPFCDKRYRNEYSLKKHIAKKHAECAEWCQCLKCFKAVPSKAEMADHLCEMIYLCFECVPARNLCTDVRLYNHRTKFHRGQNSGFKCNLCNQKFLTPRKLRKHKKMSHVFTKTYQCHFCEELFISETAVTTHERIHTGIIKFECKICDFKCNRFLSMEDHVKDDHGYLCSICQSKLSEWADLKNHMLIDHGGYLSSEFNSAKQTLYHTGHEAIEFVVVIQYLMGEVNILSK